MRTFSILLCTLLLLASCKRAPRESDTATPPNSFGSPPAAFQGLLFHAPYEQVLETLVQRYGTTGSADKPDELYFDGEFWGYPATAKLHFLSNSLRALESVRVMVPAPLKQVVAAVEPDFEFCRPYARRRLKFGVGFFWSDSTRVIFTVHFMAKDFNNTEVAFIDSRPYWKHFDTPTPDDSPPPPGMDDSEPPDNPRNADRWEGSDRE